MTDPAGQGTSSAGPRVAIACQGGGSHTAFTAGVLGRLLTSAELAGHRVVGLSGTSGGAVCAVLAWSALRHGDRGRASALLGEFWEDNAAKGPVGRVLNSWSLAASAVQSYGLFPTVSPYHTPISSIGLDQFRRMLERHIDFAGFEADAAGEHPMLLLGAVDVCSGRFRAFNSRREAITADRVLASAAIPTLFRAVHVDGGTYWDGLFSQNPPVRELLDADPDELWVIQVNPRERDGEPRTVFDIANRRNELSGNLSLYQELGFIEKIDQLLEDGLLLGGGRYKQVVVRVIELPRSALPGRPGPGSKLNRDPAFLRGLIASGEEQADIFLTALAFERAWATREVNAVLARFAEGAVVSSAHPFAHTAPTADREHVRAFVASQLCERTMIDPVRKQLTGDGASWSVRVRSDDGVIRGTARVALDKAGISRLRLGPDAD